VLRQWAFASFIVLAPSLASAQPAKFQIEEATIEDIQAAILKGELTSTLVVQLYSGNCRLRRGTSDFAAKRSIEDKGPEWNNARHEGEQRTAKRPAPRSAGPNQEHHEGNEEDAVDAANNANSKRKASNIFQRHGNEE
jgi:hypothetical protein